MSTISDGFYNQSGGFYVNSSNNRSTGFYVNSSNNGNSAYPSDTGYGNVVSAYALNAYAKNPCSYNFDGDGTTWSGTSIVQARNNNGTYYSKFN